MIIIGNILLIAITILVLALTVRVIVSWLTLPSSKWLTTLYKFTDPILDYFRKNFPIRIGILDLSIIIPFLLLSILYKVVDDIFIRQIEISIFYPLIIIIHSASIVLHFIVNIICIIAVILIIINIFMPNTYNPIISAFRSIIDPIVLQFRKFFKIRHKYGDIIYLAMVIVTAMLVGFIGQGFLNILGSVIQ